MGCVLRRKITVLLTNGNVVVIVDGNQVTELQMTSSGSSLRSNTLHGASITEECICVVVDNIEARLVESTSSLSLSNGETNSVGETLSKRTSCDFDTGGVVGFGVTGADGVDLLGSYSAAVYLESPGKTYTEALDVVH